MNRLSAASVASNVTVDTSIATLDILVIRQLALTTRSAQLSRLYIQNGEHTQTPDEVSCDVVTPPNLSAFNVVHEVKFADRLSWNFHTPSDRWDAIKARIMHLDIVAMEYIMARMSLSIPRLQASSTTEDNALGHPYMIMDKVCGTQLSSVWQDKSWGSGERSKQVLFDSLAGHMVELAALEFDKIGRLDRTGSNAAEDRANV